MDDRVPLNQLHTPIPLDQLFSQFKVLSYIGGGVHSLVYKILYEDQILALKVTMSSIDSYTQELAINEIDNLTKMESFRNYTEGFPSLKFYGTTHDMHKLYPEIKEMEPGEVIFMAMPLYTGVNMFDQLSRHMVPTVFNGILFELMYTVQVLDFLHGPHEDLHLENIMFHSVDYHRQYTIDDKSYTVTVPWMPIIIDWSGHANPWDSAYGTSDVGRILSQLEEDYEFEFSDDLVQDLLSYDPRRLDNSYFEFLTYPVIEGGDKIKYFEPFPKNK